MEEKPNDKIFIDGDFNDSYEARIQRSKNKKITPMKDNSGHSEGGESPKLEEKLTKEQAILSEAKPLIETYLVFLESAVETSENGPPQSVMYDIISCRSVLKSISGSIGSVAAPKPDEPTQKINPAMLLMGFMWKDENKFPKHCISFHHEKGVSIDETELIPYLMKLVRWVEDMYNSRLELELLAAKESIKELLDVVEGVKQYGQLSSRDEDPISRAKSLIQ